jgi:hypothetical protein
LEPEYRVILPNFGNKLDSFYPLSFSPKGERFCSFPPGGRLGWGSLSYQNKLYELTVTFIVKNYTAGSQVLKVEKVEV